MGSAQIMTKKGGIIEEKQKYKKKRKLPLYTLKLQASHRQTSTPKDFIGVTTHKSQGFILQGYTQSILLACPAFKPIFLQSVVHRINPPLLHSPIYHI